MAEKSSQVLHNLIGEHRSSDTDEDITFEHWLIGEIIERAVNDIEHPHVSKTYWYNDAVRWLCNGYSTSEFSFVWCCEIIFPKNPDAIRRKILARLGLVEVLYGYDDEEERFISSV
jgi:hypothetical protein